MEPVRLTRRIGDAIIIIGLLAIGASLIAQQLPLAFLSVAVCGIGVLVSAAH
ncbi:MAG: hypothetical protein HY567_00045 [Candidatus Kerfeldbacteria bacterium]|nr:hypothetical protein [Candidatus Kerfeldbacteria bacterium]